MAKYKWSLDPSHSEVSFKVKHLMITTITGYFGRFTVDVETDSDDFSTAKNVVFTAEINSINTNDVQRDEHLKSADFFDSKVYNYLKFRGTQYVREEAGIKLTGDLTISDITKAITVDLVFAGIVLDGYGQTKAGFSVSGKLSRKDFGLTWDAVTEAGNIVVSDEVSINAEIQLIREV